MLHLVAYRADINMHLCIYMYVEISAHSTTGCAA